jgi:tetratricopeptide (TPR) repeat protein
MPLYPWAASTGLARDSTALSLHNTLAAAYAGEGRYALAIQTLVRALRQRPDFALGHANLGGIYFKLGQYQQAEPHLRQATQHHPRSPVTRRRLGELLLKTDRPDSALAEFSAALTSYPSSATLYYLAGLALEASGRRPDALKAYLRARGVSIPALPKSNTSPPP